MSKEDIGDAPEGVPKKRRKLEEAPDLWIAQWLARNDISPSDRRKLEAIRLARKSKEASLGVGVIYHPGAGLTPDQVVAVAEKLKAWHPTRMHHTRMTSKWYMLFRQFIKDKFTVMEATDQDVIKNSDKVIVCMNNYSGDGPMTDAIRYCKHRNTPVVIIQPDGGS